MLMRVSKNFHYEKKMSKRNNKGVRWLVIERPTGSIVAEEVFEDKAQEVVDFQNKHKVWVAQGGVPTYITLGKI
jgi:hypothetical protein